MTLDKATMASLVKLVIFIVVTTMATSMLVVTIGNISFTGKRDYRAEFVDATGVVKGDDIRIAGVRVGSVTDVEIVDRTRALVSFTVNEGTSLSKASHASIRYRNLVGQRYISLSETIGDTGRLQEGQTIPVAQTSPALDLTVLFNGFKPLFQALSPDDLNKLSFEVIRVFQGEGGTLESLLQSTASVTQTLADRDEVISDLIENLNRVLVQIGNRDDELTDLIQSFRVFVGGLKTDRKAILGSLDQISALSVETADLIDGIREPFVEDITQLRRFAGNLDRNKAELDRALKVLPIKLRKVGRTAIYGSWFNFYLCQFRGRIQLPKAAIGDIPVDVPGFDPKTGTITGLNYSTGSERCDLG